MQTTNTITRWKRDHETVVTQDGDYVASVGTRHTPQDELNRNINMITAAPVMFAFVAKWAGMGDREAIRIMAEAQGKTS